MHIFKYLPEGAVQIQFIRPYYEYFEDEDGYGYEECTNEDRCTDVPYLINKLVQDRIPFYYRRRTAEFAFHDKRTWIQHCGSSKIPVKIRKVGRRVVFEYCEKLEKKYAQHGKYYRNSPVGKIKVEKHSEVTFGDLTAEDFYADWEQGFMEASREDLT